MAETQVAKKQAAAKKESVFKKEPAIKKDPAVKKESGTKKDSVTKKELAIKRESATKKEATIKKEPVIKKEPAIKKTKSISREPGIKPEPASPSAPSLGLINGYYDISCPNLDVSSNPSSLIICLDTPQVWGAYTFGDFHGIIRLPYRPYRSAEEPIYFRWRGYDFEQRVTSGSDCEGWVSFLGDGRIGGMLNLYGPCEFSGTRIPEEGTAVRSAASMRGEWESYDVDSD